jgi:WD40 repeat protein
VITSSLDRTVKVWNINNIFEQVHVIDRHEMQIDSIRLCQAAGLAVTVTRGCVGVWDMQIGRLIARLADSPLGAIVTHASITADSKLVAPCQHNNRDPVDIPSSYVSKLHFNIITSLQLVFQELSLPKVSN